MTQRALILIIVGMAVMVTTTLLITVSGERTCSDSLGPLTGESLTLIDDNLSTHLGESEQPFSREFPAIETSTQAATVIVSIRSGYSSSGFSTVLISTPDLLSEFRSSIPTFSSIRTFVLRI